MKWLAFLVFSVAFCSSLIWIDRSERNLTRLQRTTIGVTALAGWILTIVLGWTA